MSSLCGTCKFWGNTDETHRLFRTCQRFVHDKSKHSDGEQVDEFDLDDEFPDSPEEIAAKLIINSEKAVTVDGSGYFAALRCRSDFGCVYHEANQ